MRFNPMTAINPLFARLSSQINLGYRCDLLSLLEEKPNAKLLDCGCFNGEFTSEVAKKIGTKDVCGFDIASDSLAKARAKGIRVHEGNLNDMLPFEQGTFDVFIANQVIEHLSNTDLFIKEIYRVLRPGGYAVISTPNLASLPNMMYLLLGMQPWDASVSDEVVVGSWHPIKQPKLNSPFPVGMVGHRRLFTVPALAGLLQYYGLKVERSIGSGYYPIPHPLSKLACLIDKRHSVYITVKVRKNI